MKRKNKFILGTAGLALSLMALGAGMYGLNTKTKTASADTVSTSSHGLTYGVTTCSDGTRTAGSPDFFDVYMRAPRSSGTETIYNGYISNYSNYYFNVVANDVYDHISFALYKGDALYESVDVSGNSNFTTNFGALTSGDYTLRYECRHKKVPLLIYSYTYEYSFEVDVTDPSYTISTATGSGSFYSNKDVRYSATDTNFGHIKYRRGTETTFSRYNGESYTVPATDENNGYWYFFAVDAVGNQSTIVSRYIDTVPPVGMVENQSGDVIPNGGATNEWFIYSATDGASIDYMEYKKPGATSWERYPTNTAVYGTEGWYYFRAVDTAGNVSDEYRVYYDTTRPIGAVFDSVSARGSGSITNKDYVKYKASDSGSGIDKVYVLKPGGLAFTLYTNDSQITEDGTYFFKAVDKAGNVTTTTHEITLDKTPPAGFIYTGDARLEDDTVTSAAYIYYEALDVYAKDLICYVKKPGSASFVEYEEYTKLTAEGKYEFYSVDDAGNRSKTSVVTINRSIPTAQLYVDGKPIVNGSYTNDQYIKFVSDSTCFVKKPGATSFTAYVSGTEFYAEGRYEFYAKNEAGTRTDTHVVIIDRRPKTVNLNRVSSSAIGWNDIEVLWTDGDAKTTAPITRITVNGMPYVFGDIICSLAGNTYNIVVYDAAGNTSETRFSGGHIDLPTITIQKEYWEVKDGWSDYVYSFHKYENALSYATSAERRFVVYKTWTTETWDQGIPMDTKDSANAKNGNYYVYKSEDDPAKQVAYFTQERLDEVVKKYAEKTITAWYYWQKEPENCLDGDLNAYAEKKKIVAAKVELREGLIYTLDGLGYTDLTITEPGAHTLLIEDGYGGSVEYEIYILNSAPTLQYALGDNSPTKAEYDRTYYFRDRVTISVPFEGDELAMFVVYYENGDEVGYFDLGDTCTIEESGIYSAMAVNHFGETKEFKFVVSMNAPTITPTENAEKKTFEITVEKSVDKVSHITYIGIAKSTDGETWLELTQDDYGKAITAENLKYSFCTSGIYKVTVMDEFRTGIDAVTQTIAYEQPIPEGVLTGVEDGGYTNQEVVFTWTDDALVSLTKDGIAMDYQSGEKMTADGAYALTFSNYDGYSKTYNFVIDTVAPVVVLEGIKTGEYANTGVKAHFADDEIAVIYKDGSLLGAYMVGTNVGENGKYRIVVKDRALNETAVTFIIDTTVDWSIDINEKGLANSVVITANEKVEVLLTKNGEAVEYTLGNAITEIGEYSLIITDMLGNTESRNFAIVAPIVREFTHNFDDTPGFEKVLANGEDKRLNYGTLELFADGVYEVGVVVDGETYSFTVTVDSTLPVITLNGVEDKGGTNCNVLITVSEVKATLTVLVNGEEMAYTAGEELTAEGEYLITAVDLAGNCAQASFTIDKTAPTLVLNGVKNGGKIKGGVSLSELSETAKITVKKDGKIVEYTLGETLKGAGRYEITVTDACGNVSAYSFEIAKGTSPWVVVGIVAGCLVLIGGVVVIILKKRGVI
jgi:hypothetical protein